MTKIEFTTESGAYAIAVHPDNMAIDEVVERLLIPVLMAAGYGDESIRRAFAEQEVVTDAD